MRESHSNTDSRVCTCGGLSGRFYGNVQLGTSGESLRFQPHFNHSVGAVVHSLHDYDERLKVLSDRQSEQLGIEHSYVRVDPDASANNATGEGLGDMVREEVKRGLPRSDIAKGMI